MHLGDVVSCFSRGSLSSGDEWPNTSDDDSAMPLVFGCVSDIRRLYTHHLDSPIRCPVHSAVSFLLMK